MREIFITPPKFFLLVLLAFVGFSSESYAQDESFARKRCVEVGFPAGTVGHAECVKKYLKSAGKDKNADPVTVIKRNDTPLKIAFAYVGPIGDGGWTYAHEQGRKAIKKEFGDRVVISYEENVSETS